MPHDSIRRRTFLRQLAAAAAAPAVTLAGGASAAAQVTIPSEFDLALDSTAIAFRAPGGMTLGYMSQPKTAGMRPGVVLLHDVGGLSPGMRGVARNLATSGYTVVAPDFLSAQGGTASIRGGAAELQKAVVATTAATVDAQTTSALAYAKSHGGSGGRGLGLLGVGWGATQALLYAAGRSDVAACVAFYPDPEQTLAALPKIAAPVLAIFAADDPATTAGVQRFEQAAATGKQQHVVKVFPGVARGFHDPGEAKIYKPDAAKEAWMMAVQHLDAHTRNKAAGGK
jgi:carboxymethylenebutenolidase